MASSRSAYPAEAFDPRCAEFAADPHPFYARLRAAGPVHFIEAVGDWWAVDHAECLAVLGDGRFIKGPASPPEPPPQFAHLPPLQPSMLFRDPPDHTRLRSLVTTAFTPQVIARLAPRIQALSDELIDDWLAGAASDLMAAFAFPLPATVIAEMLGVPRQDRERFKDWSARFIHMLDGTQPEEVRRDAVTARFQLLDYFHGLAAERRRAPTDDLIGRLVAAEEQGDRLSAGEVLDMCALLLAAGHETTTNLIGAGVLALLRAPGGWAWLRGRPDLLPAVVEELLRYCCPVQLDGRIAAEDLELGGQRIAAGESVVAVLASANRDEAVFPHGDRLDFARPRNPHLAFGRGIHFCLGAPLARLEARLALETLLRRLPGLALDGDRAPVWNRNLVIRGLAELPVRLGQA